MAVNSLDGYYSLGIQSAKDTAATAFITALCTISGGDVRFDKRTPLKEHPGGAGSVPFANKAAVERTGYTVPNNATFLLRPRFICKALRTFCQVATVNNTTHYTHTFTPSTNAQLAWATVLAAFVGDTTFVRRFLNGRMQSLSIDAQVEQIQCALQMFGLKEGDPLGSETPVAEIGTELSPYSGSISWSIAGTSIAHPIRGALTTFGETLEEGDRQLFSQERVGANRQEIAVTGTIRGVDMDAGTFNLYRLIKRGSAVATAPSLAAITGPLTLAYQSLTNITGAAVPFSVTQTFPKVQWEMETPNNQDNQFVRGDVTWELVADSTPAFTIVVVNDQSSV